MEALVLLFRNNMIIQPLNDIHIHLTLTDLNLTELQSAFHHILRFYIFYDTVETLIILYRVVAQILRKYHKTLDFHCSNISFSHKPIMVTTWLHRFISNTTANFIFPLTENHSYLTLTHLNLSAINSAFNQGKRAFASHNYRQAIQSYTIALNLLYEDLESTILLHRAVAKEKLYNYQSALDDCIKIKDRARHKNPDVYWATANILLGQGKLKQAAAIYKKGSDNLSGHHKKQFEKRYHDAVAAQIDHNQWLARLLPYEVLTSILLLLPWSSRGQLALTCRFWYKYILKEWSEMWSCIDSVHMMPHHPRAIYQLLDLVQSHQVRKVKINLCGLYLRADKEEDNETISKRPQLYGMGDLSQLILKTILNQNWNKIKYLDISPLDKNQLRSVLQVNKDSIKQLTLHHQTNNNYCSPEEMLIDVTQICSHLSTVVHNVSGNKIHLQNIKTILLNAPSSSNLHLTKLILRCKITFESLIHIFKRALYLNFLELQNHELNHARVLKIIYEHCPQLQTLSYFGKPHYCTGSLSATYTYYTITKSNDNNNTLLAINTSSYNYRSSSSGRSSLKFLKISIKMDRADQELDQSIQLFLERDRSSLQVLTLDWKPHHTMPLSLPLLFLSENNSIPIVKHCFYLFQLQKLTLECEAATHCSKTTTSLSTTTTPSSSPSTLSLPSQKNHTQQWLSRFISLCPNLQEVELRCSYYYFEDGEIYSVLRKLKHLERLTLDFCLCNYRSATGTDSIKSHQNRENVAEAITSTNGISTLFSHQQHQSSNLRYLKIMHSNRHTYHSLGIMLSGSVVDMVSCMKKYSAQLCKLDISNIEYESTDQVVTILKDLKECRGLNTLKIRWPTYRCVCEKELVALSSLQDLEDLEIFAWHTVFNKPTLMRLFELRQEGGVRLFIVKINMNDGQYLGGHRRFASPSPLSSSPIGNSHVKQDKQYHTQCLHKKYSIYDKSVYYKEDKIEDIYCKECNSRHQWRILT
ncbi:hypothetical protein BDC45DRAFT_554798 [Circinella umbellata]|nr:hypothetical protein BDC45DRAFT_554798 [Circinella umbellata]